MHHGGAQQYNRVSRCAQFLTRRKARARWRRSLDHDGVADEMDRWARDFAFPGQTPDGVLAVGHDGVGPAKRELVEARNRFAGADGGHDRNPFQRASQSPPVRVGHASHQLHYVGFELFQPTDERGSKPVGVKVSRLKRFLMDAFVDPFDQRSTRAKRHHYDLVSGGGKSVGECNGLPLGAAHAEEILHQRDPHDWGLRAEKEIAAAGEWHLLPGMGRAPAMTILMRWAINALGVFLAAALIPGISYVDGTSLVIVVLLLGLFNAFLKPLLVFFALPFVILTLGFGILFINALLFMLAAHLVEGFHVDDFFSAFLGAVVIGLLNLFLGRMSGDPVLPRSRGTDRVRRPRDDDVIDV